MGHKKKLNHKKDMNAKTSHDQEMLEFAKGKEREKRMKTVRIDRSTIILIDAEDSEADAVKRFRMNVNQ